MRINLIANNLASLVALLVLVSAIGCSEETTSEGNDEPGTASTDPARVESALEEILKLGDDYVDLLVSIESPEDAKESWSELNRHAAEMQALGTKYADLRSEITLSMDTSPQFKEFNQRLESQMTRLNSDPDIAQMLLALGQTDSVK